MRIIYLNNKATTSTIQIDIIRTEQLANYPQKFDDTNQIISDLKSKLSVSISGINEKQGP